jgi:hypothetical protein
LISIIEICDQKIKHYKALLEEYQQIKSVILPLLSLNNEIKRMVISLIDTLSIL